MLYLNMVEKLVVVHSVIQPWSIWIKFSTYSACTTSGVGLLKIDGADAVTSSPSIKGTKIIPSCQRQNQFLSDGEH